MDLKDFTGPVNIGSTEMVSINQLAEMIMKIAGKKIINQTYRRTTRSEGQMFG